MWPNGALSDLVRGWEGTVIGDTMCHYVDHLESLGHNTKMFWNIDAIASALEKGQKSPHIQRMLMAMYDTEWEDDIRDWARTFVHEQYGPELGDLCLLQNLVHFI